MDVVVEVVVVLEDRQISPAKRPGLPTLPVLEDLHQQVSRAAVHTSDRGIQLK